jgi:peptidoglycan hydrolase-like protein with peptidoglycan-binding domain
MRFNPSPYSPDMPDLGNYGLAVTRTSYRQVTNLSQGSKGGDVGVLHEALDSNSPRRRYVTNAGATSEMIDGTFGPKTKNAVKAFQKDHGLTQDGVVGPNTWSKLSTSSVTFTTKSGSTSTPTASGHGATQIGGKPTVDHAGGQQGVLKGLTQKTWFWPAAIGGGVLVLGTIFLLTSSGGRAKATVTKRPRLV